MSDVDVDTETVEFNLLLLDEVEQVFELSFLDLASKLNND